MKQNNSLLPQYYDAWVRYFVLYLQSKSCQRISTATLSSKVTPDYQRCDPHVYQGISAATLRYTRVLTLQPPEVYSD